MAGPIRIAILGNGRQARAEAALTARAYGLMGRKASSAGKLIAGAFAVTSLVRAGAAVVKVGGDYVGSLNKIQALTDSSDRVMAKAAGRLEKNAGLYAKMGQTTGDAAAGVVELTKAGLSLNSSLSAVKATMTLAKAGELEVADASTLVANTLNTFSLKAKDAGKIANGLANAANISSADVADLAESFKYVAPIAAKAGVSLDQTNAILAELSNEGVKASQAGTGLRKFLLSLQAPGGIAEDAIEKVGLSVYNARGQMRPLPALIEDMRKGLSKLSTEEQNRALKNIFGLTGITSAQIILKNGAAGLKTYTKGVQRAGAAQKLANAQSKGLLGTLKSLKATGVSTIQSLYRQFSPKLNKPLAEAAGWLAKNQDSMIATGKAAAGKLVPAIKELWTAAVDVTKALKDTVVPLAKDLLPALKATAKVGLGVVKFFNGLPGPVKEIGVQAAIAALILPRLSAGVTSVTSAVTLNIARLQQWRAEMTYGVQRAANLSAMMTRLSGAAKTAAGIGGMVALTQGAEHADDKMGLLLNTLGGAAVGFSLGGPIGALIGGVGGGLLGLHQAAKKAAESAQALNANYDGLASTLDQVTGATTAATRAFVFDELTRTGAIKTLQQYGLSARTAVSAVLGQKAASEQVSRAIRSEQAQYKAARDEAAKLQAQYNKVQGTGLPEERRRQELAALIQGYTDEANAHKKVVDDIRSGIGAVKADTKAVRERSRASQELAGKLKAIPPKIRAKIEADGIAPTLRGVARVAAKYRLVDKKKIRALIVASGADATVKQVRRVVANLQSVKHAKGKPTGWLSDLTRGLFAATGHARTGGKNVRQGMEEGPRKAKANLSAFQGSIRVGANAAKGIASSGGNQVGSALKAGVIAGFSGTASQLAAMAYSAVAGAVGQARKAGDIHSPSRKMHKVGTQLGEGLSRGMAAKHKDAKKAGRSLVQQLLKGADKGLDGIRGVLDRIDSLIRKRLDGKKQAGRRKSLLKSLHDEHRALLANGKAQDRNAARLEKATQKLRDLTQRAKQYAKDIKDGVVAYGSIVGLGTADGGSGVSLSRLLSQLTARAAAAKKYADLIKKLRSMGLNKTSIQQLLDAGVEGGLATAEALASGGAAAVAQVNSLTSQIASTGTSLGEAMRKVYFSAGLQAAQGLVNGLKKKQRDLDRIAERLANSLVRQVKKALGIHSPSRVFRDIGKRTVEGLTIGLDDTHVKRAGANLAGSLQTGFGQPALAAYMSSSSASREDRVITVKLTAQQLSAVQRGREIQLDIDAYKGAGGRVKP